CRSSMICSLLSSTSRTSSFYTFVFFSSRRRHTRCYRDWSSDVCSSDLFIGSDPALRKSALGFLEDRGYGYVVAESVKEAFQKLRSEERRVGKECRAEWSR